MEDSQTGQITGGLVGSAMTGKLVGVPVTAASGLVVVNGAEGDGA